MAALADQVQHSVGSDLGERFERVEGFRVSKALTQGCTCLYGRLSVGETEALKVGISSAARPDQETSL